MFCRHCQHHLEQRFLDLGCAPPSNAYLSAQELSKKEIYYPLTTKVCTNCWLVQTEDYASARDLFTDQYAYFSSVSQSLLDKSAAYVDLMSDKLSLNYQSMVVEVASNDGYLLQYFQAKNIPCIGIEPTASTAAIALQRGLNIYQEFFNSKLASKLHSNNLRADLIVANNVLAHVPDINDFVGALKIILKEHGTITLEYTHLLRLIENTLFDTVYHEHFSYLSLFTVSRICQQAGLQVYHVEEIDTQGGSLRTYVCHREDKREISPQVGQIVKAEYLFGLQNRQIYQQFQIRAEKIKNTFRQFLIDQKQAGRKVYAYGAAAKGNTLLNFAEITADLLALVVDNAPAKQGKFLPGSHIPIFSPEVLFKDPPDYLLILPWNLAEEIKNSLGELRKLGTRFVTAVPDLLID